MLLLWLHPIPHSFAWLILTQAFKRGLRYNFLLEGEDLPTLRAEEMLLHLTPVTADDVS